MAGAYCKFCGRRCFVLRVIPDGHDKGRSLHLATCQRGMEHDREATGHDHETAVNPVLDPEAAEAIAAAVLAAGRWADPLSLDERYKVARLLARACKRFWDAAAPRLPDARNANAFAYALSACSTEMSELHLDVTERAEVAAR